MSDLPKLLLLNGPNLNLLGSREPEIYGTTTLSDIEAACAAKAKSLGFALQCLQSNSEGSLVDAIQAARGEAAGIVINPGAYSHTSIAILDALTAAGLPVVEVHLSNIHQREDFRQSSYVSKVARGVICGFGAQGYELALDAMKDILATGGKT